MINLRFTGAVACWLAALEAHNLGIQGGVIFPESLEWIWWLVSFYWAMSAIDIGIKGAP